MLFKDVIGNKTVKQRLIESVRNERISHAQLFLGPEGSGKLAAAIAYAQYVSCSSPSQTDSCGVCPSCKKYTNLIHPDLHFVYPVVKNKKANTPVSDDYIKEWRQRVLEHPYLNLQEWFSLLGAENTQGSIYAQESQSILRKLSLKAFEAAYKVMIIWMPEKMNVTAANKLLKMIEEPPAKTLFILVAENDEAIINTIRSRVQLVKFSKIPDAILQKDITERYQYQPDAVENAVNLANGNYLKALQVLNGHMATDANFEAFTNLMRLCYGRKVPEVIQWVDQSAGWGRERLKSFFEYSLRLLRENFVYGTPHLPAKLAGSEKGFTQKFSNFITEANIAALSKEFQLAYLHIERNGYSKLVLLDMALSVMKLIRTAK